MYNVPIVNNEYLILMFLLYFIYGNCYNNCYYKYNDTEYTLKIWRHHF